MALSQKAQQVEEENARRQSESEVNQVVSRQKIYWHQSSRGQLANFEREKHEGGRLVNPERPLRFEEHIHVAENPEEEAFIEKSNSFRTGVIKFCGYGDEGRIKAASLTSELNVRKDSVRQYTSEIVSTSPTVTDMRDIPDTVEQAPVE